MTRDIPLRFRRARGIGDSSLTFAFVALMTSSTPAMEPGRRWSSVVIGKIKSLWNSSATALTGLNQLVSGNTFFVVPAPFFLFLHRAVFLVFQSTLRSL